MSFRLPLALALGALFLPPAATNAETVPERSDLWKANCAKCHGGDGKAETEEGRMKKARDLSNGKWQKTISDDRMIRSITRGRDKMPSFAKVLSEEEIKTLVKEVRTLAVPPV
jgi:mono/diheme cytochrome c family protein